MHTPHLYVMTRHIQSRTKYLFNKMKTSNKTDQQ